MPLHGLLLSLAGLLSFLLIPCAVPLSSNPMKTRILLLGDSTTIGNVCREVDPQAPQYEQILAQVLVSEKSNPLVEVLNKGHDGDFIHHLLVSGRYDREIASLKHINYIIIRYGVNDMAKREDVASNFPLDYQLLIKRLRQNFPDAQIVPSLVIPFLGPEKDETINALIRQVAKTEKLPVFDAYSPFQNELADGKLSLYYRSYPWDLIPENKRVIAAPFVHGKKVTVMDGRLDVHFGDLPGWFDERHPNPTGYHVLGLATGKFLSNLMLSQQK